MKKTFNYWLYAKHCADGRIRYELSDIEWTSHEMMSTRVVISAHTVTHDLPEVAQITPAIIEKLQDKKQAMQAAASVAISDVDEQIQNLLALTHEVES